MLCFWNYFFPLDNLSLPSPSPSPSSYPPAPQASLNSSTSSSIDPHLPFEDWLRHCIICFITFLLLSSLAYRLLCRYHSAWSNINGSTYKDSQHENLLILTCAPALATSAIGYGILPAAMVISWIPTNELWMLSWLNQDLILTFWDFFFFLNHSLLFGVVPLIYLFNESDITHNSYYRVLRECISVLTLLYGLLYSLVFILKQTIYTAQDVHFFATLTSVTSAILGLTALVATPLGYRQLWFFIIQKSVSWASKNALKRNLQQIMLEQNVIHRKIQLLREQKMALMSNLDERRMQYLKRRKLGHGWPLLGFQQSGQHGFLDKRQSSLNEEYDSIRDHLFKSTLKSKVLLRTQRKIQEKLTLRPLVRNGLCLLFLCVHWLLWSIFILHLILGLLNGIFKHPGEDNVTVSNLIASLLGLSKGTERVLSETLQFAMMTHFLLCSLIGSYQLPGLRSIHPKKDSLSMQGILLNCGFLLILSEVNPLLLQWLGLHVQGNQQYSLRLHRYFLLDSWLWQYPPFLILYRLCFLIGMSFYLFSILVAVL